MWLIWWLMFVAILDSVNSFCPAKCKCLEAELRTFCNNSQIDLVPIMLNPQLKELFLNQNKIRNIYSSFTVYQELKYLDVSRNLISDIGRKSFIMQKSLKVLLLNGNNISQINNLSFYGLSSLFLLNVSHNQLNEIHNRVFMGLNKLETLDLSHNLISFINKEAFLSLLNLKVLILNSNRLKQIPTHSFFYLQNLSKLHLNGNLFTHIGELAFASLGLLEHLSIEWCYINSINHRSFFHLNNLTVLNLQNNNLFSVPSDSLTELVSLKVLILSNNFISTLKSNSFKNLVNLQTLILSNSPLHSIDSNALRDNVNLVNIILENNKKLKYLHPSTFASQYNSLKHLTLRSTQLRYLDERIVNLKVLQHLDVRDNPFECNCSIVWLVEYLRSLKGDTSFSDQIKCETPVQLNRRKLMTLNDSDLWCSQFESLAESLPDVLTCVVVVLMVPLIILLVLLFWRHKLSICCMMSRGQENRTVVTHSHRHPIMKRAKEESEGLSMPGHLQHMSAYNHARHPLLQPVYYPPIINEQNYPDSSLSSKHTANGINYQTMLTTSTRTSAISVDLYRPPSLHYVADDIANI